MDAVSCVQNDVRPCTDASGMGWGATIKAKDTRGARRCCPANAKAKCGLWTQHFPKQTENGEFGQPCCLAKLCVTGEISYVRGPFRSEDAWGDRSSAAVALPPRNTRRGTAVGPSESRLGKNKKKHPAKPHDFQNEVPQAQRSAQGCQEKREQVDLDGNPSRPRSAVRSRRRCGCWCSPAPLSFIPRLPVPRPRSRS